MWFMHTSEYYSAVRRAEPLIAAAGWRSLHTGLCQEPGISDHHPPAASRCMVLSIELNLVGKNIFSLIQESANIFY